MTKEMKRPTSHISGNSIKPALSKAVEFYTDNNRQAYECIRERDDYIDYLERKLNNANPQQALPVVPEFVAKWIEYVKEDGIFNALALLDKDDMPEGVNEWLFLQNNDDNINLILRAWLDGYTVEKPQLFYLKHIDMSKADKECDWYLITDCVKLCHEWVGKNLKPKDDDFKFTQQEIDSMETGSYEQIKVEVEK